MEKDGFDWYWAGGFTGAIVAVLIMIFAIYGASRLYYRGEKSDFIAFLSSEVINQELIIKKMKEKVAVAQESARVSRNEAQKLLRAHKWVEIFRAVLPECIDDDWDGEIEKNEDMWQM